MPDAAPRPRAASELVVLGFDFGLRRIGIAIGNCLTGAARPLEVVESAAAVRWPAIARLLHDWHPGQLVVGIPRHPDGAPNTMTAACERFARQLEGRYRLPVARVDERYSTAVLDPGRATDDAAAAVILQQWLDATHPVTVAQRPTNLPSPLRGKGRE